jgi:outer membrane protein, heavy metal efflux system
MTRIGRLILAASCAIGPCLGCAVDPSTGAWVSSLPDREPTAIQSTATMSPLGATPAADRRDDVIQAVGFQPTSQGDSAGGVIAAVEPTLESPSDMADDATASQIEADATTSTATRPTATTPTTTSLEALIDTALSNHPAIKALAASTQKAAGYRTQSGLYPNPVMGYQALQLADQGTDQHVLFAEQELVTANKLALHRRVQDEVLAAQLHELEAQRLRVVTDVKARYYEVLGYQKQLALIKEFGELLDRGYELAQQRFKAAEGSKIDVLQTKVQRSEIDLIYRQTTARYEAGWRAIAAITGVQELTATLLDDDFPDAQAFSPWSDLATTIVQSSPEYSAAQARVRQAQAELTRQGVQAVPNVTVQFGAGVDNGTDSGLMNLQVSAPIPYFNKNQGNIAAARAEYCRAMMDMQRVDQSIRARLAEASSDLTTAQEAVTIYQRDILPSAQEAMRLAESAYEAGEMDFIQVLVARRTYFESSLAQIQANAQRAIAEAQVIGCVLSNSLSPTVDQNR